MKQKLLILAAMFAALAVPRGVQAYDFSAVAPSGQTLYYNYNIVDGGVRVTYSDDSDNYSNNYDSITGSLVIPSSVEYNDTTYTVTSIGIYAFYNCSGMTSVTIPNSVTSIDERAFYNCSGMTSVTIPNSVTSIGSYAFRNCSGLTSITIPNSVTSIYPLAFSYCTGLTSVYFNADSCVYGGYTLEGAFDGCTNITSFIFGDSVRVIPRSICMFLTGLTSVTIPSSVTSIGSRAFYGCSGLTLVNIPNSVTSIGSYAFSNCSGLTSITIPNSVTSINEGVFDDCSGLTSVTIGNSVTSIGGSAFAWCSGLTSVTIPDSVTSIGNSAFYGCSGLHSLILGESVNSIGYGAFSGTGLGSSDTIIVLAEMPPTITFTTFSGMPNDVKILVPCGTTDDYQNANNWNSFTNISENPSCYTQITAVPNNAAYGSVTGGGVYAEGSIATLAALPYSGHSFNGWADGNSDNPRLVQVTGDSTFTANFAPALTDTVFVTDTVYNYIHDTTVVIQTDTIYIHDTVYVTPDGIDDVATANVRLYQRDGQIVVEDADGGMLPEVAVYDAVGRRLSGERSMESGEFKVPVPVSGVYMVKIGDMPVRRVVVIR